LKIKQKFLIFLTSALLYCAMFAPMAFAQDGKRPYYTKEKESAAMIAARCGLDGELVAAMNNIEADDILESGFLLWLPEEPMTEIVVSAGDTLWDLSRQYGTSVAAIVSANEIENPAFLRCGQTLSIPSGSEPFSYDSKTEISVAEEEESVPASAAVALSDRGTGFNWPLSGIITSAFGSRSSGNHHGLDIAADSGTIIRAAKSGKVSFCGWLSAIYGNCVMIDHGSGIETLYAHASELLTAEDAYVEAGDPIAKVGATGRTTGPHLHFEIRFDGKAVDPQLYLR